MEIDFTKKHIDRLLWLIDLWIEDLYTLREDARSTKNIDRELTDYEYIKMKNINSFNKFYGSKIGL